MVSSDRGSKYLWVEKYRPQSFDGYVFNDETHRLSFQKMVREKNIPHLLLSGVPGSGKTTLAFILMNQLGINSVDSLTINASDQNSVDVMRDTIKSFVSTYGFSAFKVVHLEEAEYISIPGQAILRRMMEEYSDSARFILTCNNENKIIPELKSRCQQFRFKKPDIIDVTERVAKILIEERVKFDIDLLDRYVLVGYPDIRKIINLLQQNTINGILLPLASKAEVGDYKFKLIDHIESGDWYSARMLVCSELTSNEEWAELYRFLYENIHKSPKFSNQSKWEEAIVTIADHLYKDSIIADKEINAAAMFIRISQL